MIKISFFFMIFIFSQFLVGSPECRKAKTYLEKNKNTINWILSRNFDNADLEELRDNLRRRHYDLTDEANIGDESHELNCNRNLKIIHHVVVFLLREYKKAHPAKPELPKPTPAQPTGQTPTLPPTQETPAPQPISQPPATPPTNQTPTPQPISQPPASPAPQPNQQTPQPSI